MWTTIIDLALIQLICVLIIDISGFMNSLKWGLSWLLTKGKIPKTEYRIKPLDCSFCMMFWSGLVYLLIVEQCTLPYISIVLLLSYFTQTTKNTILLVGDILDTVLLFIEKILRKINDNKGTI